MGMRRTLLLSLMVVAMLVVGGCGAKEAAQGETGGAAAPADTASDENGLGDFAGMNDTNLLVMGTLRLEGTGDAVTPEQAGKLLPLWSALQSGALRGTAESDAVLKQIRGQMTEEQLAAIDAMGLTADAWRTWLQEQGLGGGLGEGQGPEGAPGPFASMSEEERAEMREQFQSMTADERATAMAERGIEGPAGGAGRGGQGGAGGFAGSGNPLLRPLIDLLTERAAE